MNVSKATLMLMLIAVVASGLVMDDVMARGKARSGAARAAHHSGAHHSGTPHRHHVRVPVFVGAVAAVPAAWPARGYAPGLQPAAPVYYIEQTDQAEGEWLYCSGANAYFPYVAQCVGGWQRVTAQPIFPPP